jgi:hypothetical protein
VGHHGSESSTSPAFLEAVAPQHAVISVGHNAYGHPREPVLQRLAASGAKLWRTDLEGTVVVSTDGRVLTLRADSGRPVAAASQALYIPLVLRSAPQAEPTPTAWLPTPFPTATIDMPTATPVAPTPTAVTPTATPVPPTPTPLPPTPPPGEGVQVSAWVSNETPARYTTVTVYGRITHDGVGVASVPMGTVWHYRTTTPGCSAVTGSDGVASCSRAIGGATADYHVRIDVTFSYLGQEYTATTGFTPQ